MADIINGKLKPSKTFNWFFEPYALVEPQKIKSGFCPKCYAKVNSENNQNCCGFCGQSLEWEGYNG